MTQRIIKSKLILILLLLTNCNLKNNSQPECKSMALDFMLFKEELTDQYMNNYEGTDDQQFLRIQIIEKIDTLNRLIVKEAAGGFTLDGQIGCFPVVDHYELFNNYRNNKIKPLFDKLDQNNPKSRRFHGILNEQFFIKEPFFDKEYFEVNLIEQLSYDLIVTELYLIN